MLGNVLMSKKGICESAVEISEEDIANGAVRREREGVVHQLF